MATISRLVAIGRRMNSSEGFTNPNLTRRRNRRADRHDRRRRAGRCALLHRRRAGCTRDPGSRRSWPSVTIVSPGFSPCPITTSSFTRCVIVTGALLDRRVGLHDEDEWSVLTGLHGLARHDGGSWQRRQLEGHAGEFARPQAMVGVLESRLELDRVGGGIDGVVDEDERSGRGGVVFVLRQRGDGQRIAADMAANRREARRGHRERHITPVRPERWSSTRSYSRWRGCPASSSSCRCVR